LDRTAGYLDTEIFDLNTKKCLKEEAGESNLQDTTGVSTLRCRNLMGDVITDNLNTMTVEIPDGTMSSSQPHLTCESQKFRQESNSKKFCEKNNPLSSSIRLWESRECCDIRLRESSDLCCVPTRWTQSVHEQEVPGNRTVIIIIERVKEVEMCENCESCCFEKEGRQKPGVAQNMNFSCIRRRAVTAEGEGHQRQEAQSVNPSFGSIEAKCFGEEGHKRSVNSPVNKMCVSPTLFSVCHCWSRVARGTTKFSKREEERGVEKEDQKYTSAKVDQIQYLSFDPRSMQPCVVMSQHVRSGRRQDGDLVQEDDSDSVERRGHQKASVANQCISHSDISPSSGLSNKEFKKIECVRVFPVFTQDCTALVLHTFGANF